MSFAGTVSISLILCTVGLTVLAAPPTFDSQASRFVRVREDEPVGNIIKKFNVTDTDPGEDINISISDPTTNDYVNFTQTSGHNIQVSVMLKRRLDRDRGTTSVRLKFTATDKEGNQILLEFDMYIEDLNDEKPAFKNEPYRLEIFENSTLGSVYTVSASDLDGGYGGYVTYAMKPDSQSDATAEKYRETFSIDNATGEINLTKSLDYETNSYYQFNITAQDMSLPYHRVYTLIIIRVLDVQDKPPFFTGIPYRRRVKEDVPIGTSIITIAANDGDPSVSNPVAFTIEEGDCSSFFNITPDGTIETAKLLSRDEGEIHNKSGVCSFPVKAYEINGTRPQYGNTTTTTDVTVIIEDVNNNIPEFVNKTFEAEVQENTPKDVPIILKLPEYMVVFDKDQGLNSRLRITLNTTMFTVTPETVQDYGSLLIRVANSSYLDYEERKNITFEVTATEVANSSHVARATVVLHLIDMNDNNPLFDNKSYSFIIDENVDNGTLVGTISASDKDSGKYGNISYSLSGGNERFIIGSRDGRIRTNCDNTTLDREILDVYYLSVTATDGGGRSNATSVEVHLQDVNDNPPEFLLKEYTASISENDNRYNATPVIVLTATDKDKQNTDNSEVLYSVKDISDPSVNLTINDIGEIFLQEPVDFEMLKYVSETSATVIVIVEAKDEGRPSQSSTTNLTLLIQDENDNAPHFNQTVFFGEVFENETSSINNHTDVVQVFANDADKTSLNKIFDYFIISGSYDKFSIDSVTGVVYVKPAATLDRETRDFYNITVSAIDHGSPPLNGSAVVSITVKDVNDVAPKFNETSYAISVPENNQTLDATTCFAYDEDENHELQFKITEIEAFSETGKMINSSLVQQYFSIGISTGTVSIDSTADREVAEMIRLRITVTDLKAATQSQTATTTLTVTLLDVNDNHPQFDKKSYNFSVSENARDGSIISTIHATDKDVNRTISYKLNPGPVPTSSFSITNDTGILRKNGSLDREFNDTIDLVITATDNGVGPLSSNLTVHITISDFNDNAPKFIPHNDTYFLEENVDPEHIVALIEATDADVGLNRQITYSVTSSPRDDFKINGTTGEITTGSSLDRENVSSYTLTVVATDNPKEPSEQKSNQTTIHIKVTDINDNAPIFNPKNLTKTVREDADVNFLVLTITASDKDERGSNNSKLFYEMTATNCTDLFKIDRESGYIQVSSSLKGSVGKCPLNVIAKDYGSPQLNGTATVTVAITDVNLNAPAVVNLPSGDLIKTYECARINSMIYNFTATDADHGKNAELNYSISHLDGNTSLTYFWIDWKTGVLNTKTKLTDMGGEVFQLQLVVFDLGDPVLSSAPYYFTIEILDVNDHPPEFTAGSFNMSVLENHMNVTFGAVNAIDEDKNSVSCYNITDSPWSDYFNIDYTSGSLTTAKKLDRENITSVTLNVIVHDCSAPENKSAVCDNITQTTSDRLQTTVYIVIDDMDDNPPIFIDKEITFGVRRSVEQGSVLNLQLKEGGYVKDKDRPENGQNKWTFRNFGPIKPSSELKEKVIGKTGVKPCEDKTAHIFCIFDNGSITNNYWFSEDMSGFFEVPVIVSDDAGNDTASIKIYLIADSQVLIMTIFGRKANVSSKKADILTHFSKITHHDFVYDDIADHKTDDGIVDVDRTDLYFHVVDPTTSRVLSAAEAQKLVDQFALELSETRQQYLITQIVSSVRPAPEQPSSERTIYILVAAVSVLSLTLCIIIYLSCSSVQRYRRKLKAATISTTDKNMEMRETAFEVPGSNQYSKQNNPLLNQEEPKPPTYDSLSLSSENSLDANEVDEPQGETLYDRMEEKEVTIDLYNDDELKARNEEDPLSAVLRLRELSRSAEILDSRSTADSDEGLVKENGEMASCEKITIHGFINEAFDNLEHSEI